MLTPATTARVALAIASCAVLATAPAALAQRGSPTAPLTSTDSAAIDAFVLQTMKTRRIPGVAVAVVNQGTVVYKKAFGVANLETDTPLTVASVFELASVTKQFTAGAIMMLAEEGKVNLDASIATYIDRAPPAWSPITVRHLLTHTSGLFAGGIVRYQGSALQEVTTEQAFEFVSTQRVFPTGDVGFYSDAGYFLLGMIIEKTSGLKYRDFLQRRIFDPLQMTQSSVTDRRKVLHGRVSTYEIADGALVNWRRDWDYELPSFFGIWSTLDDVAMWDHALPRHTLISQASLDQMWTPASLTPLAFLTCDAVDGKGIRITDPISRICYYRATAGGRATYFTFWLTRDNKAAHLQFAGEGDY